MNIDCFKKERGKALLVRFINGYSKGWKFCLPEAFKEALDIKITSIHKIWTQGILYNFDVGDTLYDAKEAYTLPWKEALKYTKICVKVIHAIPTSYEVIKSIEVTGKEDKKKYAINRQRINFGKIKFKTFIINNDKTGLIESEDFECNQDEFVSFLQSGVLKNRTII